MCSAAHLGGSGRKEAVQPSFLSKLILTKNVVHRNVKMLSLFLMQNSKIKARGADRTIRIASPSSDLSTARSAAFVTVCQVFFC